MQRTIKYFEFEFGIKLNVCKCQRASPAVHSDGTLRGPGLLAYRADEVEDVVRAEVGRVVFPARDEVLDHAPSVLGLVLLHSKSASQEYFIISSEKLNQIQTQKGSKERLFIMTQTHNMQICGVMPFAKPQNDT